VCSGSLLISQLLEQRPYQEGGKSHWSFQGNDTENGLTLLASTETYLFKITLLKAPNTHYSLLVGGYEFSGEVAYVELLLTPNPQHEAFYEYYVSI